MNNTTTTNSATAAPPAYPPALIARVDAELRALDAMSTHQLATKYREIFHRDPPIRHRTWTHRRVAYAIQAKAFGDLSDKARARIAEIQRLLGVSLETSGPTVRSKVSRPSRHDHLAPGSVITRTWHGQEIRVLVRADGTFEMNNVIYKSLSASAAAATGAHWSGSLFFNLRGRSRK